jgi:hypothetical protein
MEVKIYAEKQEEQIGIKNWLDLMTPEEVKIGRYYTNLYLQRQMEIAENKQLWDRLIELYACQREPDADDPDYPNSFIALMTPCIEGQVASIIEGDIEFTHTTDNPAHTDYMVQYDAASEYARRKNKFTDHFKDYTRGYDLLGNACMTTAWEKSFSTVRGKPSGYPRLTNCPLLSVMVDGRIKDVKDLQYAEYIIHEIGFQTIGWAKDTYGEDKGNSLWSGYNRYEGEHPDESIDDNYSFTLLHVWTRSNKEHNLQLIEMDANGFVLRISDSSKSYYKYTDNEYPFYFSRMIPVIGQFYGHGDGTLLKGLQEFQNNLADEVELACRFSAQAKIIVDPRAKMATDQLTSNPSDIAICISPNENIKILQSPGINPIVTQMMDANEARAQRITRFNDIMTGNQSGVSATATQINSQMMQGSVGINDKKSDIARAMEWVDRYSLKLCMEYWDKPFWANLGYNYSQDNKRFVDPMEMLTAPSAVPITKSVLEKTSKKPSFLGGLFGRNKIKTDLARGADGNLIYTDVDFDTKVFIGKGIARGKTDMYNILKGLAGTILINPDGTQKMAITPTRWIELMEQTLGIKLSSEGEGEQGLAGTQFDQNALNGQNPIGNNNTIQTQNAVPGNLQATVPQLPSGDSRSVVI